MIRIILRTVVILATAGLLAGLLYLAVGPTGGNQGADHPGRPVMGPGERPDGGESGRERLARGFDEDRGSGGRRHSRIDGAAGAGRGGHGHEQASIGRGLAGALGTAVQAGLIIVAVVWVQRRLARTGAAAAKAS
jgi:hypothetical protein